MSGALSDLRVIEIAHERSCYAAKLFADMGADVIVVEPPEGATARSYEPFVQAMQRMDNPFFGMLIAAAFTALVQSSSATTGIVIVLASQGFISLEAGIALAFGANVGTCITAILAALGKPRAAARAAFVHVIFNVVGVLLWLPLIAELADEGQAATLTTRLGLCWTKSICSSPKRATGVPNAAPTLLLVT